MDAGQIHTGLVQALRRLAHEYPDAAPEQLSPELRQRSSENPVQGYRPRVAMGYLKLCCIQGLCSLRSGDLSRAVDCLWFVRGALWVAGLASLEELRAPLDDAVES